VKSKVEACCEEKWEDDGAVGVRLHRNRCIPSRGTFLFPSSYPTHCSPFSISQVLSVSTSTSFICIPVSNYFASRLSLKFLGLRLVVESMDSGYNNNDWIMHVQANFILICLIMFLWLLALSVTFCKYILLFSTGIGYGPQYSKC